MVRPWSMSPTTVAVGARIAASTAASSSTGGSGRATAQATCATGAGCCRGRSSRAGPVGLGNNAWCPHARRIALWNRNHRRGTICAAVSSLGGGPSATETDASRDNTTAPGRISDAAVAPRSIGENPDRRHLDTNENDRASRSAGATVGIGDPSRRSTTALAAQSAFDAAQVSYLHRARVRETLQNDVAAITAATTEGGESSV